MNKIINLSVWAICLLFVCGCNISEYDLNQQIPEYYHKILYLQTTGKQELILYDTGEKNTFNYTVIKTGSDPSLEAVADIRVLSQEELDNNYGLLEGINYRLLPKDTYSLENSHLEFSSQERYKNFSVSVDPELVRLHIESNPDVVWVLPLFLGSESDSINSDKNSLLLQFTKVVNPSLKFLETDVALITEQYGLTKELVKEIRWGLNIENIGWDITCDFVVDSEYVDLYNAEHQTLFQLLDTDYSFEESVLLPKGKSETMLVVNIATSHLEPGDYMLPIKLNKASMFSPRKGEDVFPLAIRIMGNTLDRTGWTVSSSSETVEGNGNGAAINIFDGNINTYWHSKWDGGFAPLPHELVLDTKQNHKITQVALQRRLGYDYARLGNFYISNTGDSWKEVGTFKMDKHDDIQVFSIVPSNGRFFKIKVTESNNNNKCAAFSEVYLYGI